VFNPFTNQYELQIVVSLPEQTKTNFNYNSNSTYKKNLEPIKQEKNISGFDVGCIPAWNQDVLPSVLTAEPLKSLTTKTLSESSAKTNAIAIKGQILKVINELKELQNSISI
jgi:hypothetical protein